MSELRALTRGELAPAATPAASAANAAAFQQQLAMAGGDPTTGAGAGAFTPEVMAAMSGGGDPYAALNGGGLSAQAQLLSQLGLAPGALPIMGVGGVQGAAPVGAMANVTGKTNGLDQELLRRLDAVGRELGAKVDVISGHRTFDEQAKLYAAYKAGTGNLAARPGTSNHEHGGAADAYVNGIALADVPGARDIAARHGLHFPVGGESWHVERTDG